MLLVATATRQELAAALDGLGAPLPPDMEQGRAARLDAAGHSLLVLFTGVGMLNAALALGRALAEKDVRGVLNLGLAGSFDTGTLPLAATCAVESETWPEYGLGLEHGVDAEALRFPLTQAGDGPVWNRLRLAPARDARRMRLSLPEDWPLVRGLTVNTVSATPERAGAMREAHGPDIESMEGFAQAYACHDAGLPFLQVRTVSNLVGSRQPEHWAVPQAISALGRAARALLGRAGPGG